MFKTFLCSSLLVLISCTLLVSTSFAWFTDSVSNTGNRIQAGTLKIDLLMDKSLDDSADEDYVSIKDGVGDIFKESNIASNSNITLWEPGKTQMVYLAIENQGDLALKYNVYINVTDEGLVGSLEYALFDEAKFTDLKESNKTNWTDLKAIANKTGDVTEGSIVVNSGLLDEISNGTKNERDYVALAVHMNENADNDYQEKDIVIDVAIVATQASAELDGFESADYDSLADFDDPAMPVHYTATKVVSKDDLGVSGDVVVESSEEVKATITNESALSLLNDILSDAQQGTNTELLLKLSVDTSSYSNTGVTYEIGMTGTVTTTKDGKTVSSEETKISNIDDVVEIVVYIDKGLENVSVKHSGVAMSEATTKADQTYSYDPSTGLLSIYTKSFSPFEINYDYELYVVDNNGYSYKTSLVGFADLVNNGKLENGCTAYLLKDVDLSETDWMPIGNWKYPFNGTFDGQNHKIIGLSADENNFNEEGMVLSEGHVTGQGVVFGFFGIVGNGNITIKDVDFIDVDIVDAGLNAQNVGTLIGYIPSTANYTDTEYDKGGTYAPGKWDNVENIGKVKVLIENVNIDGIIDVKGHVGGFIGKNYSEDKVTINNSSTNMQLTSHNTGGLAAFVGINKGNVEISNCEIKENATLTFKYTAGNLGGPQIFDYCYDNENGQSTINNVTGSATVVIPDNTKVTNLTIGVSNTVTLNNCEVSNALYNYGKLTINGGEFNGNVKNYGELTINDGEFSGSIINYGELTIEAGTATGSVTNYADGVLTIDGGEFSGNVKNYGELTINDGTFSKILSNYKDCTVNGGNFNNQLISYADATLTLNDGTFAGKITNYKVCTINGGTYQNYIQNGSKDYANASLDIKAGTFAYVDNNKSKGMIRNYGILKVAGGLTASAPTTGNEIYNYTDANSNKTKANLTNTTEMTYYGYNVN